MHYVAHIVREGPGALVGAVAGLLIGGWLLVSSSASADCSPSGVSLGLETLSYVCGSKLVPSTLSAPPNSPVSFPPFIRVPDIHVVPMSGIYLAGLAGGVLGFLVYNRPWSSE